MGGRLKAAVLLLIMFGFGVISGISWERYVVANRPAYPITESARLKRFYQELQLTPAQEKKMDAIFEQAHARATEINEEVSWDLNEVHDDALNAIQAILTPEQRTRFEVIRHHLLTRRKHKRHLESVVAPEHP